MNPDMDALDTFTPNQDWLAARTLASPERLALIIDGRRWTYAELQDMVNRAVAFLLESGVQAGERVAVLSPNSLAYVCLVHALARLGAVLVPLNTRLTAAELAWQLDHVDCGHLLYHRKMGEKAASLADAGRPLLEFGEQMWAERPTSRHIHQVPFRLDNVQAIVFTSGTTGRPKGATLTYANHFWSATASAFRLGLNPKDRWLSCLPLYHVGGLAVIFRSCLYGTAVVLQEGFALEAISRALDPQAVTLVSLVPTMLHRLLEARAGLAWPDSLRLVLLGGAAASQALLAHCREVGLPVAPTYGLTEAASQVATMLPDDVVRKPGSVGKPLLFTSVRIADDQGLTLPAGEYGEIVVSGPTIMAGYFRDDAASSTALRRGELFTGDVGYLDEDGDLWLVQRRSDVIVSGGENVYPAEVEAVLRRHTAVADACVVGVDDQEWGQRVAALIALHHGDHLSQSEIIAFCRQWLAGYKIPRRVRFVEQLPRTASGKVRRPAVAGLVNESLLSGK